jgi:hypothetical protein
MYSRIVNKVSNLILVPFGPLAEWLKLFTPLAAALGPCPVTFIEVINLNLIVYVLCRILLIYKVMKWNKAFLT